MPKQTKPGINCLSDHDVTPHGTCPPWPYLVRVQGFSVDEATPVIWRFRPLLMLLGPVSSYSDSYPEVQPMLQGLLL